MSPNRLAFRMMLLRKQIERREAGHPLVGDDSVEQLEAERTALLGEYLAEAEARGVIPIWRNQMRQTVRGAK